MEIVIVGLVILCKWLIKTTNSGKAPEQTGSNAGEILKERYAWCEIDKAEF